MCSPALAQQSLFRENFASRKGEKSCPFGFGLWALPGAGRPSSADVVGGIAADRRWCRKRRISISSRRNSSALHCTYMHIHTHSQRETLVIHLIFNVCSEEKLGLRPDFGLFGSNRLLSFMLEIVMIRGRN